MSDSDHHLDPAARVIEQHGGITLTAKDLGIPYWKVHRWGLPADRNGRGGLVPSQYQKPLLEASARRGTGLTAAMIIGVE